MNGKLILENKSEFEGVSFGSGHGVAGEVVFSTGMMGYPESLTDPSYKGQILIATYPLVGNYGVPDRRLWESDRIHVSGLIVSTYNDTPSHFQSKRTLSQWLQDEKIPALQIKDTRLLTQKIRSLGTMLGKIVFEHDTAWFDPGTENLVEQVSIKEVVVTRPPKLRSGASGRGKTVVLIDCGAKWNIRRCLVQRGIKVITVPWNYDVFNSNLKFDAIVISNGPGDPKMAKETIQTIKKGIEHKVPILGVCLGHQLLALAAGGDTYKLKFGHRSQNQPCMMVGSPRCYITTQNHGYAVSDNMPANFKPWFVNANDNSNEGIIHEKLPIMSVQFHPEASAGPMDTEWIFDYFLEKI